MLFFKIQFSKDKWNDNVFVYFFLSFKQWKMFYKLISIFTLGSSKRISLKKAQIFKFLLKVIFQ